MKISLVFIIGILGVAQGVPHNRIVNGDVSSRAPYHVHIEMSRLLEPSVTGTGSGVLISLFHVLTTASNLQGFNTWRAGFGSNSLNNLFHLTTMVSVIHEDYSSLTQHNNIGILVFLTSIPANGVTIVPMLLPLATDTTPDAGDIGTITSFGRTSANGALSNELQSASSTVMNGLECMQTFPGHSANIWTIFCGKDETNLSTVCEGDQGGAFILPVRGVDGAVGLISHAQERCVPGSPVAYVRVTSFRTWIRDQIGS